MDKTVQIGRRRVRYAAAHMAFDPEDHFFRLPANARRGQVFRLTRPKEVRLYDSQGIKFFAQAVKVRVLRQRRRWKHRAGFFLVRVTPVEGRSFQARMELPLKAHPAILLDGQHRLLDGQHRLAAVTVTSGEPGELP